MILVPLIKPDVRISRIRLTRQVHHRAIEELRAIYNNLRPRRWVKKV